LTSGLTPAAHNLSAVHIFDLQSLLYLQGLSSKILPVLKDGKALGALVVDGMIEGSILGVSLGCTEALGNKDGACDIDGTSLGCLDW